ncbi:LytR C-terminal domain-containing protein [Candidatus Dojkabacteria bacterium]|nr:LytR C-terminal domain-containing protein [Candidatus Dojkabacteria bacterium]
MPLLKRSKKQKKRFRTERTLKARLLDKPKYLLILRILIVVVLITSISSVVYWFYHRVSDLNDLEFSQTLEDSYDFDYEPLGYNKNEVFTLLILVDLEDDGRTKVDDFVVIQIDSNSQEAFVFSFHPDIYFYLYEYSGSYESVEISRVRDLPVVGDLHDPPRPVSYTYHQLQEFLAIRFNGYILIKGDLSKDFNRFGNAEALGDTLKSDMSYEAWAKENNEYWINFINTLSIFGALANKDKIPELESNLEVTDLYGFVRGFKDISLSDVESVYLKTEDLTEVIDERGDQVTFLSETKLDEALGNHVRDIEMEREQARVEVFNGSGVGGLGARYKRWLEHLGADVIRVGNASGDWDRSVIYVTKSGEFDYTMDRIQSLWEKDVEIREGRPDFVTTGDIIVILGADF